MVEFFILSCSALADAIIFFVFFDAFFKWRQEIPRLFYGIGILCLSIFIIISNRLLFTSFTNAVVMILLAVVFACLLYDGRLYKKVLIGVLGGTFIGAIEIVVLFLIAVLFSISVGDIMHIQEYQFLGIIISKLISLAICQVIHFKVRSHFGTLRRTYWILFFILLSSTIIAVFLLFKINYEIDTTRYNNMAVFASVGLLVGTVFALYLYERLIRQGERIRAQEQYEQHMKEQMNHLQDILAKQNELRKFKHDIFNKLGGLKGYLLANDVENGLTYLDTLADQLQMMTPAFNTGNIALDATLSTKKALAESKGILFETELRVPKNLPIKPEDICVIFGNALDNAIEGCERVHDRRRRISVSLVQVHDHLLCDITNTATEPTHADLATSKEDTENHGFGLSNLKESLAKYDSEPEILWENGQFSLKFTLYLNAIE